MVALAHIEVEELLRHKDSAIALHHNLLADLGTLPAVYQRLLRKTAAKGCLVPHRRHLTILGEDSLDATYEHILQLVTIGIATLTQPRRAVRTLLPLRHIYLVATDMEVLRWEEGAHLCQNLFENAIVALLGCANHTSAVVVAIHCQLVVGVVAEHIGIDAQESCAMTREVYLGDNLDIALCCVCHNLLNLLLGVVTAILLVPLAERGAQRRVTTTETTHLSQVGVRLNLYAPALRVGQVPMQFVYLVVGDIVNIAQHILLGHKSSCHIEHKTTIGKLRFILHLATLHLGRQRHLLGIDLARKELEERLHAIEHSAIATTDNLHSLI